jgi:hypothetical protein
MLRPSYTTGVVRRLAPHNQPLATSSGLPTSGIILTLCLAALVRLALAPLTHGHDFVVWNDASRMLVRKVNPYTHRRAMPNAYSCLPVFLYMLLPLQWLALHMAIPFTLLGKLPSYERCAGRRRGGRAVGRHPAVG